MLEEFCQQGAGRIYLVPNMKSNKLRKVQRFRELRIKIF